MNNDTEHIFRTKTGTCTLTRDHLTLQRESGKGSPVFGNLVYRNLIINGILSAAALGFGIWLLAGSHYISGVFLVITGAYFLWSLYAIRNNSGINYIERATVISVEAHAPLAPVNRGYFIINFNHQGRDLYRLIMLPGTKDGGMEEYPKALAALRETGWLPDEEETKEETDSGETAGQV